MCMFHGVYVSSMSLFHHVYISQCLISTMFMNCRVYIPPCLWPTVSIFHHVHIPPCLCPIVAKFHPTVHLVHRVCNYSTMSMLHHVWNHVSEGACSISLSLSLQAASCKLFLPWKNEKKQRRKERKKESSDGHIAPAQMAISHLLRN